MTFTAKNTSVANQDTPKLEKCEAFGCYLPKSTEHYCLFHSLLPEEFHARLSEQILDQPAFKEALIWNSHLAEIGEYGLYEEDELQYSAQDCALEIERRLKELNLPKFILPPKDDYPTNTAWVQAMFEALFVYINDQLFIEAN